MDFDAAIAKYNGQVLDNYGGECVSLAANYCIDNGKPIAYANAKDWWGNPALTGAFDFVTNDPNDYSQIPPRGAIIIWSGDLPGSGGYGHIAIFDASVGAGVFRSLDNNWGGRYVHFVTHNWNNIIGWMVPKSAPVPQPQGDEMIANTDQADKIYKMLRPNGSGSPDEINGTAGNRSFANFLNDAQGEIASRDENLRNQTQHLSDMQANINQLNQAVTDITSQSNATKGDKDAALVKIADLIAQITSLHDQITDLQNKKPDIIYTNDQQTRDNVNLILKVVQSIRGLILNLFKKVKKGQ